MQNDSNAETVQAAKLATFQCEQQHKFFIFQQKKLFKQLMFETFYDLTDHPCLPYEFENKDTNERWLGWLDCASANLQLKNNRMIGQ